MTPLDWEKVRRSLRRGRKIKSGSGREYVVADHNERKITLRRPDTGSTVSITRSKCEKTVRNLAQAPIPFRKIDYTVAIEQGIVAALLVVDAITVDAEAKEYRASDSMNIHPSEETES